MYSTNEVFLRSALTSSSSDLYSNTQKNTSSPNSELSCLFCLINSTKELNYRHLFNYLASNREHQMNNYIFNLKY
jgi:hypothetical protein